MVNGEPVTVVPDGVEFAVRVIQVVMSSVRVLVAVVRVSDAAVPLQPACQERVVTAASG